MPRHSRVGACYLSPNLGHGYGDDPYPRSVICHRLVRPSLENHSGTGPNKSKVGMIGIISFQASHSAWGTRVQHVWASEAHLRFDAIDENLHESYAPTKIATCCIYSLLRMAISTFLTSSAGMMSGPEAVLPAQFMPASRPSLVKPGAHLSLKSCQEISMG